MLQKVEADGGRNAGNAAKLLHLAWYVVIPRLSSQPLRTPWAAQTCENNSPAAGCEFLQAARVALC